MRQESIYGSIISPLWAGGPVLLAMGANVDVVSRCNIGAVAEHISPNPSLQSGRERNRWRFAWISNHQVRGIRLNPDIDGTYGIDRVGIRSENEPA